MSKKKHAVNQNEQIAATIDSAYIASLIVISQKPIHPETLPSRIRNHLGLENYQAHRVVELVENSKFTKFNPYKRLVLNKKGRELVDTIKSFIQPREC